MTLPAGTRLGPYDVLSPLGDPRFAKMVHRIEEVGARAS